MKIKRFILFGIFFTISSLAYADTTSEYLQLVEKFNEQTNKTLILGKMPSISNREVLSILSLLSDHTKFLDTPNFQVKDIDTLDSICGSVNKISVSYVLFGIDEKIKSEKDPSLITRIIQEHAENNLNTYQSELALIQPFSIRCLARYTYLLNIYLASLTPSEITETRIQGIFKMRKGIIGIYFGFISSISSKHLKTTYLSAVLSALADSSELLATSLPTIHRQQIIALIDQVKGLANPSLLPHINRISKAMSITQCDGLCKY